MERNYYTIDETAAKQAQGMWSFRDYVEGSKTKEYRELVDRAYGLAERTAAEKPDRAEEAYLLADRYARKLADNFNKDSRITLMCPSVMIAGPANFPVKKKERQNRAAQRNYEEYQEIQKYLEKIERLLDDSGIIKADDIQAVEKLQKKLDSLQKKQEHMKAVNAYYRKHGTLDGCPGLSQDEGTYQPWELRNNNQNIHAARERLERLKKVKEKETAQYDTAYFRVVKNTQLMRLQLFFDGKPETEIRELLRQNGFRWSPKNGCWQRQLTDNAEYSLRRLIKQLDGMSEQGSRL